MRISITRKWMQGIAVAALVVALASCSNDNGTGGDEGGSVPITATHIIVNPKSPAPGDTIRLTVDLESDTTNPGDFPTVSWTASGGTFIDNNQTSVRWIAPTVSGLYTISVTAENSVNKTSRSTTIFVGKGVQLIASNAGQMFLRPNGVDFVYMRTPNLSSGIEMYEYTGGVAGDIVPGEQLGDHMAVAPSLTGAAYEIETPPAGNFLEPVNVVYSDLVARATTTITSDKAALGSRRRHQYTYPSFSKDGTMLAYQGLLPATLAVLTDSFDVFIYNTQTHSTVNATLTHGDTRKNFYPTISTDNKWLVFISDRNEVRKWEFYGLPITSGVVATDSAATVRLTNTNGQVTTGSVLTIARPLMKWNPVNPVLVYVTATGGTSLLTLSGSGGTLSPVTGLASKVMRELAWSDDGTVLAMTDGTTILTVPASGGAAKSWHVGTEGDLLRDVTWSANKDFIIYRVTRGGQSWFELLDVGAGVLTQTVVLTPAVRAGEISSYRRDMSMSAVYTPNDELLLLIFNDTTPSVERLDISGAVN